METIETIETYVDRIQEAISLSMRKMWPEMSEHKQLGLTGPQMHMLHLIAKKETSNVSQLAEQLEVKPSAITVMIDRLLQSGFVNRHHDERDRRVVLISMTDKGKEVLELAKQKSKQVVVRYMSQMDVKEVEQLAALHEKLARIVAAANEHKSPTSPKNK